MISIKTKVSVWKKVVAAMSPLREEAVLVLQSNQIKFKTIGGSHHEMLTFIIPREKLLEYSIMDQDKEIQFRVDDMEKIIKRFSDEDDLIVQIESAMTLKSGQKEYQLLLLGRDTSSTGIPDFPDELNIPFAFEIEIETGELKNMVDDISFISQNFFLKIQDNLVIASGDSEHGKGFGKSNIVIKEMQGLTPCTGRYSMEYLAKFIKSISAMMKQAKISFGETQTDAKPFPLRIKLQVDDVGTITYFLAAMVA